MPKLKQALKQNLKLILMDDDPKRIQYTHDQLIAYSFEIIACIVLNPLNSLSVQHYRADAILCNLNQPQLSLLKQDFQQLHLPTILFTQNSQRQSIEATINAGIKHYILDDIEPSKLESLIKIAVEYDKHHQQLRQDLLESKTKLADRIDIEKAKLILMQLQKLPEAEAFALLRKNAMHQRISIGEIARYLIQTDALLLPPRSEVK